MRRLLDPIRSVFFNIAFYGFTALFVPFIVLPMGYLGGEKGVRKGVYGYCRGSLFLARYVMGIKSEFRGAEKLPKDGALILAAAHQSTMDPMMAYMLRGDVTALAKKELFRTPGIGGALKMMRAIRVDRQAGNARSSMDGLGARVLEENRALIVYPQATRIKLGSRKPLKSGAYHLAKDANIPVYTVATSTGLFWTRGFFHRSGTAIFEIKRLLPENMEKDAFMACLEEDVVLASEDLMAEAGYSNLLPDYSAHNRGEDTDSCVSQKEENDENSNK